MNIIGAEKPANFFHICYSPPAVGELSVVLNVCIDMLVTCVCSHTVSIYTNTVPDTPSGATPTVQDVTASHAEHSKQGTSVHNYITDVIPQNNQKY